MRKNSDLIYATKIWLLSVFTAPTLILIIQILSTKNGGTGSDALYFYGMLILFSLIFSIPSWLLFMGGVRMVIKSDKPLLEQKIIIQIIAIILCFLPFIVLFYEDGVIRDGGVRGGDILRIFLFSLAYLVPLSFGIWYFQFNIEEHEEKDLMDHLTR